MKTLNLQNKPDLKGTMAENIYGGPEAVAHLVTNREAEGAAQMVLPAASATDKNAVIYQAPYYIEEDRDRGRSWFDPRI